MQGNNENVTEKKKKKKPNDKIENHKESSPVKRVERGERKIHNQERKRREQKTRATRIADSGNKTYANIGRGVFVN